MKEDSFLDNRSIKEPMDASPDGILAFDRECRYTAWNRAMERISGLSSGEVLGRYAFEVFPFLKETGEDRYFYEALAGRKAVSEMRPYVVPQTKRRGFFHGHYSPLHDEEGEVVGGVAFIRDVTDRKEAEEALRTSEERYRAFIANSSEGIWRFELEQPVSVALSADEQIELFYEHGYLAECNDAMARMYGFERADEIEGARLGDLLVRSDSRNDAYIRAFIGSGYRLLNAESVETDREGQRKFFSNNLIGVLEDGLILRAWGTQRDVTESKLAEAMVRENEARFRAISDASPLGIYVTDTTGDCLYTNRAYQEISGLTFEEALGQGWSAAIHPGDRERVFSTWYEFAQSPTIFDSEHRFLRPDGAEVRTRVRAAAITDGRKVTGYIGTVENITERKRAEQERESLLKREQAARERAEDANRLKDEFLATVSHELRTPLTAILGWARLLRSGGLDPQSVTNALVTIERNARAQTQIVDDLLDVSRIITGKLRLEVQPVNPAVSVEAAIEALRPAAEAKGVHIQKLTGPGIELIYADPARLQQIVWNLLSNAVKFTSQGGQVTVLLQRADSHVEIIVNDTGRGIDKEFLPFVFERFSQADMSTTRKHGGLGLGLAIVRHLAELHGGTVRAESGGEASGSTFIVTLPLIAATQIESAAGRTTSQQLGEESIADATMLDGLRVLVVDDEADTLELLRVILSQCGAEVTTSDSADEALGLLSDVKPHILVCDIGMPEADGYELIKRVRALPQDSGGMTPAVALTAYARAEDRVRALKAGYQIHIPKPVEPNELITVLYNLRERASAT